MKKTLLFIFPALALLVIGISIWLAQGLWGSYQGYSTPSVQVVIHAGVGANQIGIALEKAQVIRSKRIFSLAARLLGKSNVFKRGLYQFDRPLSTLEVIGMLEKGEEFLLKITIPEGYRMSEIFKLLKASGLQNKGEYSKWASDPSFIASLKLNMTPATLEGFLFPETYLLSPISNEKTVLRIMVEMFQQRIPKDFTAQAQHLGLTWYQALTLASIIEKETGKTSERPIISSVFHNRLKKKMKLQTDPTVIYGIKNYNGNITKKHLRAYSPYNTYVIPALPPTPIANPGLGAMEAAIAPATTDFLYFVGKGNGSHQFSETYRKHNRAVRQFQHRRRKDYRSY